MTGDASAVTSDQLTMDLARLIVEDLAADECEVFEDVAADFFADPVSVLRPAKGEEPLGFGLEGIALITPFALAIAREVVTFLLSTVTQTAQDQTGQFVLRIVRQRLRRYRQGEAADTDPAPLTAGQSQYVRTVVRDSAHRLGLTAEVATTLEEHIISQLHTEQ
ncbi:MAG: hypothetical protein JXA67_16240 [Micromonosporaceae bacterium]|nr:hypothetical protein [Micromonosporaceae bacterium]